MKCEGIFFFFFVKATILGIRRSSFWNYVDLLFECGWNVSECFCWASSRMRIKTLPCRCLKALQSKSCYCQWTMKKLMPRKVKWFAYANKRREWMQVLWIPVLFTRLHCWLDKCNSRVDYCFQGSLEPLSYKKAYKV